jgi:Domain of unknown function (DUF6265)/Domain of unknown function (DUF4440)
MKRLHRYLCASSLAAWATAASAAECDSLSSIDWLLGEWLGDGEKSMWRETWAAASATTWEGRGAETSKADPSKQSAETLRLVEMGDGVFYLAKVAHNELPVAFRLVECGEDRLVFANPAHDFPRRLEYQRKPGDRLAVRVSDGSDKGFTLDFERQAASSGDATAVLAAEDERLNAMVRQDAAVLRRALAEELAYVHMTGEVEDRERFIDSITSGAKRYLAIAPVERRVDFPGPGTAVVQGRARFEVEAGSKRLEFDSRYLAVYGLTNGTWRLRAWQSLRLP